MNRHNQHYFGYEDKEFAIHTTIGYFNNQEERLKIVQHCTTLFNDLEVAQIERKIVKSQNDKLYLITRIIIVFTIVLVGVIFYLLQSDLHFH